MNTTKQSIANTQSLFAFLATLTNAAFIIAMGLMAAPSMALEAKPQPAESFDNSAPIEIEADSAEQNEALGVITYRGNVVIKQAGLLINAEKVSIESKRDASDNERALQQITATGLPAKFTHTNLNENQIVNAEAEKIFFEVNKSLISLTDNAKLVQNNSSVSGDHIEYLIEQRRVKAKSLGNSGDRRVHTVISADDANLFPTLDSGS